MSRARQVLALGACELECPVYFPSVSSLKTALAPAEYIRVLRTLCGLNKQFLISAYDFANAPSDMKESIRVDLAAARASGACVLLDSGNYEAYWTTRPGTWTSTAFHSALAEIRCDLVLGFDGPVEDAVGADHVRRIVDQHAADKAASLGAEVIPIIHGGPADLPASCESVVRETGCCAIAVPERELGLGLGHRARTVESIRSRLDATGRVVGLHLLGTGNPSSIALLAIAGADSFDGLEWCQTVVDHETSLLHHISHASVFLDQTTVAQAVDDDVLAPLVHNLVFYVSWMGRLRAAMVAGAAQAFCVEHLPARVYGLCRDLWGWPSR